MSSKAWNEFVLTDDDLALSSAVVQSNKETSSSENSKGFFKRLRENLSKTRVALTAEIGSSLFEQVDDETWERLEEALIMADLGAPTTAKIVSRLEEIAQAKGITSGPELRDELIDLLVEVGSTGSDQIDLRAKPSVIFVVGVNGTGKTTTVGKLAWQLSNTLGLKTVIGAADTFRAAGVEQLAEWAKRAGCEFVAGSTNADPAAVAFDTVGVAMENNFDVAIIDTAGRLHTYDNLMAELEKVQRVIQKQLNDAPHETLLVVDATTGQNGLRQAKEFAKTVGVTGVVLTKLDGSSKGGIALAIADELGLPVKLIGIGEQIEDLNPFDAREFVHALLDEN